MELEADPAPATHGNELLGSYFVSAYPPFSQWDTDDLPAYREALQRPRPSPGTRSEEALGLYLHIPFCVERCRYCYYLASDRAPAVLVEQYLGALRAEMARYAEQPAVAGRAIEFAYFGGGTPSLLTAAQIETLFSGLRERGGWDGIREITFECAPRTTTRDRLAALLDAGVNRLSMGIQQLNDAVLEASGRVHRVADVERAWERIRARGFETVNVDLMVGLRGETGRTFRRSLDRVIDMAPDSVTLYQLEIPLNTPLSRQVRAAPDDLAAELAPWEVKHARLAAAFDRLEDAGFNLRSAYTAVRDRERNGFLYQDLQYAGAEVLGLGAAAFSYVSGVHQQNVASVPGYVAAVAEGNLPLQRACRLSPRDRLIREFILQIKLGRVDLTALRRRHGIDPETAFAEPLERCRRRGWLDVLGDPQSRRLELTRAGLVRADELLPGFYAPRHQGVRYS